MRIFLLPLSTRRTLLYGQRLAAVPTPESTASRPLLDKVTTRAARAWAAWEANEPGSWKRRAVDTGNYLLRRIPYEEWALKSVPPLTGADRRRREADPARVDLVFPGDVLAEEEGIAAGVRRRGVREVLLRLGTEREAFHRRRLVWCCIGMPVAAPFGLLPIIPNFPFFYLAYRAWSHWRAVAGGRHIQYLIEKDLLRLSPSAVLDRIYHRERRPGQPPPAAEFVEAEPPGKQRADPEEEMLMTREQARRIAEEMDLPQLEAELERAVWQVENALREAGAEGEKEKQG